MKRTLFLRWACVHVAATSLFAILALVSWGRSSGVPLYVAAGIAALAFTVSCYAGRLFWRIDGGNLYAARRGVPHIHFAAELCQLLGLVGAAVGFYLISTTPASSSTDAVHHILDSLGAGIVATVAGVLSSMVLLVEHHALQHVLD